LSEVLDGKKRLVSLIQRIGQDRFEDYFLGGEDHDDAACAKACDITRAQVGRIRELIDQTYIQAEFATIEPAPLRGRICSAVAGITIEEGHPVLGFFNREIWKSEYRIHPEKVKFILDSLPPTQAQHVRELLGQIELGRQRKSTLYKALEAIFKSQSDYFVTGDPDAEGL